ncbi:MAG: radical SAM protein [Bryobacteraceae bacterium]|nr:radical SAM protein [Bryobacteraceae bacterium]
MHTTDVHPKGRRARVLLTSVFGPYAQDDDFGSRSANPMELYHNQVTREQGPYSLRMFHRSWGIIFIQANITAPCTVLDFPAREEFERELSAHRYDIVGISSIMMNVGKVREMCGIIRRLSPQSTIVVGGHVASIPGLKAMVDADYVVAGEGIGWMRRFLGEDPAAPIAHPLLEGGFGRRIMGLRLPDNATAKCATIVPSVGCPMGCNFCTTSAFFGGKGKFHNFLESGEAIYGAMADAERAIGAQSFFIMDENFLLYRRRAMELLECMKAHGKSWDLYVFSSANAVRKYTMDELVELGVSWVWMGLESPRSNYAKLDGADTLELTARLQAHGIRVLGSTIVGLEHHTPENIRQEIEHAVAHATDFHQFMLYTPLPGTPLYEQIKTEGRILDDVELADAHGQWKFNWRHPHISRDESKALLDDAFRRDFERNGPSLYRLCRTTFEGWKRYRSHGEWRVRQRFEREAETLRTYWSALLWAMERHLKPTSAAIAERTSQLRREIRAECGAVSASAFSWLLGPLFLWTTWREQRRLERGVTYEPPTFIERRNWVEA